VEGKEGKKGRRKGRKGREGRRRPLASGPKNHNPPLIVEL